VACGRVGLFKAPLPQSLLLLLIFVADVFFEGFASEASSL
jgi:hypothetical protein